MAAVLLLGACGGGGDDTAEPDPSTSTLVPSSSGDRCDDPTGDLDAPGASAGELAALAGIDLVAASASVEGERLEVRFDVAGPLGDVSDPTFVVAQGDPLDPLSFELRLTRSGDAWSSLLVTWPSGREQRSDVALPVEAEAASLTTSVPLADLPPIALSLQFGAAAEAPSGVVAIDDCTSLAAG